MAGFAASVIGILAVIPSRDKAADLEEPPPDAPLKAGLVRQIDPGKVIPLKLSLDQGVDGYHAMDERRSIESLPILYGTVTQISIASATGMGPIAGRCRR